MNALPLNRREAITRLALLMGGTMVGPRLLSNAWGAETSPAASDATAEEIALLDEIGDTIIPATNTPGAKAAHIGAFMVMMVRDCYEAGDQAAFRAGLRELPEKFRAKHGQDFNHAPASCTFDATQTAVVDGGLARVMGWYDNEWGFSNRMSDTAALFGSL